MKKTLLFISLFITNIFCTSNIEIIKNFASQYTRPVTILEITAANCTYTSALSTNQNFTLISLIINNNPKYIKQDNITTLNPKQITYKDIEMLGRCEHFDLVIIDNLEQIISQNINNYISLLLKLADFLFIEISDNSPKILNYLKNKRLTQISPNLFFFNCQKRGLDVPRWTTKVMPIKSTPTYLVKSDFNSKLLFKVGTNSPQTWISGINLKTFVMLRGIYPTDGMICSQLINIKKTINNHNDFIIGNIILNGTKLIPIDFNDRRRNSNMDYWLKRALNLFDGSNRRLKDPIAAFDRYSEDN